jgi:DNA-binding CsgD family transcriptional regulator
MSGTMPSSFRLPPVDSHPTTCEAGSSLAAVVHDADALARAAALAALPSLCRGCTGRATSATRADSRGPREGAGFGAGDCPWRGVVRLVGVHGMSAVAGCRARHPAKGRHAEPHPMELVYVLGDRLAAQLHILHGCAVAVAVLLVEDAGPRFEVLEDAGSLAASGLTPREADVLALLLARATNEEIAARIVVSLATVRAHCRSVLRKLGAADRRDLWRTFGRGPV